MAKKKREKAEGSATEQEEVSLPVREKEPEEIIFDMEKDSIPDEIEDINHMHRMINIKHNHPKIRYITKKVVYDVVEKKILLAHYITEQ